MSWLQRARDEARDRIAAARDEGDGTPSLAEPRPEEVHRDETHVMVIERPEERPDGVVPRGLQVAAAYGWRLLVLVGALYVLFHLIALLRVIIIPLVIAMLLAALLEPAAGWLRKRGVNHSLAAVGVLVTGLVAVFGTLALVIQAFVDGLSDLTKQLQQALTEMRTWLADGPLHVSQDQINDGLDKAQTWLSSNSSSLTSGALSTATTLGEVVTGFFLVLFTLFFFLRDGEKLWRFVTRLLPRGAEEPVHQAGLYSWGSLIAYVRATVFVAFVDAVGIGIGLLIMKIPLALPLAALVFLGAFIPVVGATLSGTVAIAVAFVTQGPIPALIILGVVIAVQQLEGHVLQPLIMGRAVSLHPIAVILAIAIGIVVAGIVGGLVAVPLLAVLNTGVRYLALRPDGGTPPAGPHAPPGTEPTDDKEAEAEKARAAQVEAADEASTAPTDPDPAVPTDSPPPAKG